MTTRRIPFWVWLLPGLGLGGAVLTLLIGVLSTTACAPPPPPEQEAVVAQQRAYATAQPIPEFDFSLERQLAIELYEARNRTVATHSVWRAESGVVEGDCPSIGYPLPYDTSLTNPQQVFRPQAEGGGLAIPQPEPNGLYPGAGSMGTWVRCSFDIEGRTVTAPVYVEAVVTTYPFPVEVNYETNIVRPLGHMPSVVLGGAR